MANRVLRDYTDSELVEKLSAEAEVLFIRLFMKADDYGFFHANPKLVRSACFPLKNISEESVIKWLKEVDGIGLIKLYEVNGKKYLKINNFNQRLRVMTSKYPPPDSVPPSNDSNRPPETKRNETEVEITLNKIFFSVRSSGVMVKLSEYIPKNFQIFMETWLMRNGKELLNPTLLYMDTKYAGYSFSDENHIQNSFMASWEKVKKDPSLQKPTSSFYSKKPITNA